MSGKDKSKAAKTDSSPALWMRAKTGKELVDLATDKLLPEAQS